jgi:hypothetical protein
MSDTFKAFQVDRLPYWARLGSLPDWFSAEGDAKDVLVAALKDAAKLRCPSLAPPDALDKLGADRMLPRYPAEVDAAYRARLAAAWDAWERAGSAVGVLGELRRYLGPLGLVSWMQILTPLLRYVSNVDGTVTTTQGGAFLIDIPNWWTKFSLLIAVPAGPAIPADGSDVANAVAAILKNWIPAHEVCVSISVSRGEVWGAPGNTWGAAPATPGVWGVTSSPTFWTPLA